jgi:lysylphosphatidylglycerol synthetase-like protein (DUF2156 family)/UDP-2,3-diacylglucosamine pyrophosphatase LpxH
MTDTTRTEKVPAAVARDAAVHSNGSRDGRGGNGSRSEEAIKVLWVPDEIEISVPRGGRVAVVSDLHLGTTATETSKQAEDAVVQLLGQWQGQGVLIIAGDGFEMLAGPPDVSAILDAHPAFAAALADFAGAEGHELVVMPGNHDGQLAWDPEAVEVLRSRTGMHRITFAANVSLETGAGVDRVRVVHGNQLDEYNAFADPRDPVDTPFGHHIVRQVLPELEARQRGPNSLLDGIQHLNGDPADFVGSRLFYRKLVSHLWWLTIPFVAAVALRLLGFLPGVNHLLHDHADRWLVSFGLLLLVIIIAAAAATVLTLLRVNHSLTESGIGYRTDVSTHNAPARQEASRLVGRGFAGMVSGHTHEPELSMVGNGFYANSGCGVELVVPLPARLGMPRPFVSVRRMSFVELEGGPVLKVSLWLREVILRSPGLLERFAMAKRSGDEQTLHMVASLPGGATWPLEDRLLNPWVRRRRIRRVATGLLLAMGLLNIVFAIFWTIFKATHSLDPWLPFGIHPLSELAAIIGGLALVGVARGVARGYRRSWLAALLLLALSTVDRLAQGRGIPGSILACLIGLWLFACHRDFEVDIPGFRKWIGTAVTITLVAIAAAAVVFGLFEHRHHLGLFVNLLLVVAAILVFVTALPGLERRRTGEARSAAFVRARQIIDDYGGDTLDYFALRDDKSWLFSNDTLIAYSVINRVMLVSPDPIGPASERVQAWLDAMELANANGWSIAVLAASATWLPVYRASGLVDIYLGDEAIVDCQTFSLAGKEMKSLRGAYNRMKKGGNRVEFYDPLKVDGDLKAKLLDLMTETRMGEVERGYSMTLSRMFDPRDVGLLLAVCYDADGRPIAFNQYIPAPLVNGYSLDVMRRTADPGAPNGMTDFVIIETIDWMAKKGLKGLGLNFAMMREIVAGEGAKGPWRSVERSVLHRFSDSMQIESLYRFNKKYDPAWRARYAVAESDAGVARAGLAIARAESVTEFPVVGRLLRRRGPAPDPSKPIEPVAQGASGSAASGSAGASGASDQGREAASQSVSQATDINKQ